MKIIGHSCKECTLPDLLLVMQVLFCNQKSTSVPLVGVLYQHHPALLMLRFFIFMAT